MKKLFILFLYTIFSCSSDTPVNMDEVLFDSGGRFKSLESKKVYSGPGFKEYRNGKKQEQGPIEYGWKTGKWTGWYEDGKKIVVSKYRDGQSDGLSIVWHENGQKHSETTYNNGELVSEKYWNSKGEQVNSYEEADAE